MCMCAETFTFPAFFTFSIINDLAVDVSADVTVDVAFGVGAGGEITVGLGAVTAETRGHCFRCHLLTSPLTA